MIDAPTTATGAIERAPAATLSREPDAVGEALEAALKAWRAEGDARALRRALAVLLGDL